MPEPTPPSTMRGRYVEAVRDIAHSWRFKDGVYDQDIEDAADEMLAVRDERVEAAVALHHPVTEMGQTWCDECSVQRSTGPRTWERIAYIPHPCPTIRALNGEAS